MVDELEERPQVAIRVNMDTGIIQQWDRFGFNYESGEAWNAINRILSSGKIDLVIHEKLGGHSALKHIGKTDSDLMKSSPLPFRQMRIGLKVFHSYSLYRTNDYP